MNGNKVNPDQMNGDQVSRNQINPDQLHRDQLNGDHGNNNIEEIEDDDEDDDDEPEILSVSNVVSSVYQYSGSTGLNEVNPFRRELNQEESLRRNGNQMSSFGRNANGVNGNNFNAANDINANLNTFSNSFNNSLNNSFNNTFKNSFNNTLRNTLNNTERPSQWWEDEFFKSDVDGTLNNGYRSEDSSNFMLNSNVYRQDEAESLRKLLNGIRPDEEYVEGMEKTPKDMLVPLLKHQRIGLAWMKAKESSQTKGGILADDMGLGKTVQALAVMMLNRSKDAKCKTNLVITPVSLLRQWDQEASTKLRPEAEFSCYIYHQSNRVKTFAELQRFDMVLVSYNTLASEWKRHFALAISELKRHKSSAIPGRDSGGESYQSPFFTSDAKFYRIVLDEAQNIKNKLTNASKCVATLDGVYRWCLSGTPIQNRIDELYPQLRFLQVEPYCEEKRFKTEIAGPIKSGWDNTRAYSKLHAVLSAVLLRRTKDSQIDGKPILELPDKHTIVDEVAMTDKELAFYHELEQNSAKQAKKLMEQQRAEQAARAGGSGLSTGRALGRASGRALGRAPGGSIGRASNGSIYSSILTLLLRLRQACDHYYLVKIGNDKERGVKRDGVHNEYQACCGFSHQATVRIESQRASGLTCQMCGQDVPEESAYLLSGCGHVVCEDCKTPFFDEYGESEPEGGPSGDREAKCRVCHEPCMESRCASLEVYDAVIHDKLTWAKMKQRFGLDSRAQDVNYKARKLKELIADDGGKVMVSAKVSKCVELVRRILREQPGEKVIIFSQFTTFFDILQIVLYANGISYLRYDGTMDVDTKNKVISCFYNDASKKVLLLSLKAGNVGLTLTCANHVILLEPFWNPYVEKQAQDRVHRISQTRQVYVHRILVKGTVEDRIMELQEKKERMVETALDPNARKSVNKLSRTELGFLFGLNGLAGLAG